MTSSSVEPVSERQAALLERDAWRRYLETTRLLVLEWYEAVEPHAWEQLQAALAHVRSRVYG